MKQRILSGAVMTVFFAAVILFNGTFPLVLNIAVSLISLIGVYEITKALGVEKKRYLSVPALIAAAAVPFCGEKLLFPVYCLFAGAVFFAMILRHRDTTFQETAALFGLVVLIPSALRTLVTLRDMDPEHGVYNVLVAALVAWIADIGAYFAGTFLGKHKLCPEISPKKTVEGAIGGLVLDVAVIVFSGWLVSRVIYTGVTANYPALCLIGLLGAPISIVGDLTFSLLKRSYGIKDFGQLIPGHGGILDRFDSVIFTAPFVCLVAAWLPLLS